MKGYITTKEAGEIMGVSDRHARQLAKKGEIEAIRIGWAYLIKRTAAEAFKRKRAPKSPKE